MQTKKRPKSVKSAKQKKQIDEDSWRAAVEAISINDDSWWCIVTMMVETITEHSRCVSLFNAAAEEGKRKAIYCLSYQKMLALVMVLSEQSLDKCGPSQGICHYARRILDENNDKLPNWLMARIIKYLVHRAKEEIIAIEKKKLKLERQVDEEYQVMQTVTDWGLAGSKRFDAEQLNSKANTRLRKRGEEWRDTVYVDDAPMNGPNQYIILTGFHDPDLPEHLISAGVPLTAILEIKISKEQLDPVVDQQEIQEKHSESQKLQFSKVKYSITAHDLLKFWTPTRKRMMDLETYPVYRDVILLTFCPPKLIHTSDRDEYQHLKKNMYDSVSYLVYDVYDIYRQHSNYLKSIKIQKGCVIERQEKSNMEAYERVLDGIPLECISVPLLLFGILEQVEANEKDSLDVPIDEKGDATITLKNITGMNVKAGTVSTTAPSFIEQKLRMLKVKYDLEQEHKEQIVRDIELTLHGDILSEAIRLQNDSPNSQVLKGIDLIDKFLPIFWHPGITNLHSSHEITEKKVAAYSRHIDRIRSYFRFEISNEEVKHYLHILVFDKMLHGSLKPENEILKNAEQERQDNATNVQDSLSSIKRSKSLPSLSSKFLLEIHFLSDSSIEYDKLVPIITDCSPLFNLIDPRELLVPGYLEENIFKMRCKEQLHLQEFEDVELLSKQIFLQVVYQCLVAFDHFEARYFEPIDSVLLCFSDKKTVNDVHEEKSMSSIRTPVCLRDFYEYVMPEEEDWIRQEEELYSSKAARVMERLMEKTLEAQDQAILFRDKDFILPGSLKAKYLEKNEDFVNAKNALERESTTEETTELSERGKGNKKKMKKTRQKDDETAVKRITPKEEKSDIDNVSQLTSRKGLSVPDAETKESYEFLGYDLGKLRVQITHTKKTFLSGDGTLVRVEVDDWLYKNKELRIAITLRDYTLRLFHRFRGVALGEVFHLTTESGVILAFQKFQEPQNSMEASPSNWRSRCFDFRASWPSGLLIEPVIGDGPENPYYIQQSYIPVSSLSTDKIHEVCRKNLRNGTVLKYFDNGQIIVLRPNGDIVTCMEFKKLQFKENDQSRRGRNFAKGDVPSNELKPSSKGGKQRARLSKSQLPKVDVDSTLTKQDSTTSNIRISSMTDNAIKVSRYTVLNHDGRQYEVLDDLVVSEHHRLLVGTASDYEVDEKFIRRADGTNMLLNCNGELIVGFPDGTRITTGYTIEKEAVICDWTEEEILRYFTSAGTKEEASYVNAPFSNYKFLEEASSDLETEYSDEMTEILLADGFVSVLLTCRVEHKNYATVFYDQSAVNCTLSMSNDLRVSISGRGHYEVSMADGVNLKIEEDNLSFRGNACISCGSESRSTYNFPPCDSSTTIFSTIDVFGNTFEVKGDGRTDYHRNEQLSGGQKSYGKDEGEGYQELHEDDGSEENEKLGTKNGCDHERLCFKTSGNQYRIFSMNRDLTAYEYLHRSKRIQAEVEAVFDNETSVILYPCSRRPELRRLITFQPVKPESRSKAALSFPDYKVMPRNFDRRHLSRSTYSKPYNWTFQFGRNGDGIWINTHDVPLTSTTQKAVPKLLNIRIQYGFKEPDGNAVIDLQRALGGYWMSLLLGTHESPVTTNQEVKEVRTTPEETKTLHKQLEDQLHDMALGMKKTIDVATYRYGLERQWMVPRTKARRKSIKFGEFLKRRALEIEELVWYKRCMKEGFVLPYFENVTGTCFLLVNDCMENTFNILPDRCRCNNQSSTDL